MELSKLEIKGFKSFGDRTVLHFDRGVTAVVGPNGCGKSNIVDAIRWVLGEQKTRMLRSEKMENIIFNGSKTRKPLQMAEVSMTFGNTKNILPTAYTEVTVTRKYYRSGDSEYLLNGVTCRLKDITDLFLDTGIGPDSYAIIELAMVDAILNDRDNSRRNIFEEAAGVSKFKLRKKQTLRKLEGTEQDLDRVEDLLFEITKNMKALEKQAKEADRYFKLKEEQKTYSVELAKLTVRSQTELSASLQSTIEKESDKKLAVSKLQTSKEAEIEKNKTALIEKEKTLSDIQKQLNTHVDRIRSFENEKNIKNERIRFLTSKIDSLSEQTRSEKENTASAEKDVTTFLQEKENAEKSFKTVEAKLTDLDKSLTEQKQITASLREASTASGNTVRQKREDVFLLNKELEISKIKIESLRKEAEKSTTESTDRRTEAQEIEKELKGISDQINVKNQELKKVEEEEIKLQKSLTETEEKSEKTKDKLIELNRKLDAARHEHDLVKSMIDNLEGFPEAVKFLKKNAGEFKDAPLLSDLISCDEIYRICLENYLEPYMNHYVVRTAAEAYKAVNLLNEASKGKANFIVVEFFKENKKNTTQSIKKAVPAVQAAEFADEYAAVFTHLLADVFIVEDEKDFPKNSEATFITRNGKVIKRNRTISGGSTGLFEGKRLGRAKNLDILRKNIRRYEEESEKLKQEFEKFTHELRRLEKASQSEPIDRLKGEINTLELKKVSLTTTSDRLKMLLASGSSGKAETDEKISELEKLIAAKAPLSDKASDNLKEKEKQAEEIRQKLEEEEKKLSEQSRTYNEATITVHQEQNRITNINREIEYRRNTAETSRLKVDQFRKELNITENEVKNLAAASDTGDKEVLALYEEKEAIEKALNDSEKNYYNFRGQIDEAEKEIRELQHKKEACDTLLSELHNRLNEVKIELNTVKERVAASFGIDPNTILQGVPDTEFSEEELQNKVESIGIKLERIGPINPTAKEAYEEIEERFDFITEQKEDLLVSKKSLLETVEKTDSAAKKAFLEAFEGISTNFKHVFRSLFSEEDDCDLVLSDPENPLESAVDIIAKPKGKKPLTINQLSGGEKTLTAVSLLFAVYLLKPAPFCIFDEVDAPLDDTNIDKFNTIIRKFSADSQFIIVTHNKRTMSSTDVMYGITMPEEGVSKVVPADLRELV